MGLAPQSNFEITSLKMTSVTVYTTPFGLLNVGSMLKSVPEEHILAEVRGLELLDSIMMLAETWERVTEEVVGHVNLVAKTDGYELKINVIKTIEQFLLNGDPHLSVQLYSGRNRSVGYIDTVCILFTGDHPGCAITDAIISLVLLGESGWPEVATPVTLRTFTKAAEINRIKERFKLGLIDLTFEDLEEINDVREALHLGIPYAAIDMLCAFARRCYTCKGMEIEEVRLHIQGLLDEISEEDLRDYVQNPSTPSDVLFLPTYSDGS